ncbi:uncharacterized protein LOC122257724 isoform X2 [Penaeus japonicus]|uniref:uncharacterized protein LOC122257724 isoform X2 n=1 Tax=Penaeus japonicus TaxID=27405 RepID=UPI001C715BF9|nr:uncharacterized protein LOC122257724 isoform X2 [Penaeus japonicus]
MLLCCIIFVCSLLESSVSDYIHDGCIARRHRLITSPWGDFRVSSWNPPEGEASEPLLTLMADFLGTDLPDDYTRVLVFKERIDIDVTSSESRGLTSVYINKPLPEGWLDFRIVLTERLQIFVPHLDHSILDIKNRLTVEQLFIQGSNITMNCKESVTAWEVREEPELVPLASTGYYNLSIFSRNPVIPVLSLGHKEFDLSWDGDSISSKSSPKLPLPAFTKHNIIVKCEALEQMVECSLMEGTNETLDTVYLKDMIRFFSIGSESRESFFVFVEFRQKQKQIQDLDTISTENESWYFEHWSLLVVIVILLTFITAFAIKKYKQHRPGKTKRRRSRQFTCGNFVLVDDIDDSGKTLFFVMDGGRLARPSEQKEESKMFALKVFSKHRGDHEILGKKANSDPGLCDP